PEAHYNLACLIEKTNPRDAEKHYRKSIELKPGLAAAHNDYALFLDRLKRRNEAFREYCAAIHADPLLRQPHCNLLNWIGSEPVPNKVFSLYQQLSASYPNSGVIQAMYGHWLFRAGRQLEAEKLLRKAIELEADFQEAYSWLGVLLAINEKFDQAEAMVKTALEHDPADAQAHYNLGYLYDHRGAGNLAETEYREAVRCNPDTLDAWYNLGNILRERDELIESEKCYREAIRAKPDFLS